MLAKKSPNVKILHPSVAMNEMLSAALAKAHQDATSGINPRSGAKEKTVEVGIGESRQTPKIDNFDTLERA
jgi:hypothetical protein